ncbi:predicted protein [Uncinocarpus reesii 1704]|uniref:PHD-type domain-containing protein n=1 Tax=Uncinocarpus reesii (strain UAMH 1704) TaxID=336963 RepID=C4JYR9_UNCRE|nr:uncharacterized protein UREG_07320 [Uncinocarpus reesii 1704]EEP82455.1 predicted protein [Uncinocarpus reesii 1704]
MPRASAKPGATGFKKIAPLPSTTGAGTKGNAAPDLQSSKTPKQVKKTAQKRNKKRKAGIYDDDEESIIKAGGSDSDGSDEFTTVTTQTKSGRQIHRPTVFAPQPDPAPISAAGTAVSPVGGPEGGSPRKKRRIRRVKEANITCEHCQRGHSPAGNQIVLCDDCNGAWHQFCHDPPVEAETVSEKESQWFCSDCRPLKAPPSVASVPGVSNVETVTATVYDSNFLHSQNLVGGSNFTAEERLGYLSRLSHAALVGLLARISGENPELPIFPANLKELRTSTFIAPFPTKPSSAATNATSQDTTLSTSLPQVAGAISPPPAKVQTQHPPATTIASSDPTPAAAPIDEYASDEEFIPEHRLYPKPGNGFRLPPDSVDLDILLEDPNCRTFSHALHGPAEMRAEAAVGVA